MERPTPVSERFGWLGPEIAQKEYEKYRDQFSHFFISKQTTPTQGKCTKLWDAAKKVLGHHIPTLNQAVGDCVSMGSTNAVDYLQCCNIEINNINEEYRHTFPPYVYGVSRVLIGGQQGSQQDGSCGVWAAKGVTAYGVLWSDYETVPAYSGPIAKDWGSNGPPQNFITYATGYPVKTTALVTSYTEVRDAIGNYYPVIVCSNRGFKMTPVVDKGKSWGVPSGQWGHCMCFIGVDDDPARPGCYLLNSWGKDAHGVPADDAPPGGMWVDAETVNSMVSMGDSFAFSNLNGFPERILDYLLI